MSNSEQTVEQVRAEASARTGLHDFGDDFFEGPLRAWLQDLSHPRLSGLGQRILGRATLSEAVKRLEVLQTLRQQPEIASVPLPPILLITGYVRSGTTLLHNLMARHPAARTLRRWELVRPTPPPETATYESDPRVAKVQAAQEKLRGSLLERMHWINAADPEECTWGSYDFTGLFGRGMYFAMPGWSQWVQEHDLTPHFRAYRALLQLLLWKHPPPRGGHLLLKCPQTAWHLRQFARVFPEAKYVVLHRDPFRALNSSNILLRANAESLVEPASVSWPSMFDENLRSTRECYREIMAADEAALGCVHVAYDGLLRDPHDTVRQIYGSLAMPADDALSEAITGYLQEQRSGQRLAPPGSYDRTGLDADSVWSDPLIASYCQRYGILRETARLTDVRS